MSGKERSRLWELYQNENTLRRVRAGGVVILVWYLLSWTIAPSAIALNCLTMFVLPVEAMLAVRSSRLKALKRRLVKGLGLL